MSKQTINIGASPNDGTGTPLRTSFDYTNQNFTELYTALGGGVGLPGATTQVIFNDGGTNLAGDAGLVYNKTTDALTVAGLVTAGSATITGDLTARNWFITGGSLPGVGNGNPFAYRIGGGGLGIGAATETGTTAPIVFYCGAGGVEQYRIAPLGVNTWSDGAGGTRMTLNSTGLGIGASPTQKLSVNGAIDFKAYVAHMDNFAVYAHSSDGTILSSFTGYPICFRVANSEKARIDTSGNVGIGVTPSAWGRGKGLEVGSIGNAFWGDSSSNGILSISANAYLTTSDLITGWKYATTNPAGRYQISETTHSWYTAASGTAGNAITFTQAMTLDASGNLLVGTVTAPAGTKVGAIAKLSGVSVEGTAAINVSTTPVAIAKSLGTGGLFFVTGYNTSGGNQCWFLVASKQDGTPTVIASENSTGLTVTFTQVLGVIKMNTNSGTIQVNSFAVTN